MITEVSKDKLAAVGVRFNSGALSEQAGYTLGIAALDGEGIQDLLPGGFIGEVNDALSKVGDARNDKTLIGAEAKEATKTQNSAFSQSKVWRRKVAKRAANALEMGTSVPDGLVKISKARTMPALQTQMTEMVSLLEANLARLPGKGLAELLEEGKSLEKALRTADAEQEVKRFRELPEKVIDFYYYKGLLYTGLKMINNAGHALHAENPVASGRYNMDILHRRGGIRSTGQADQKDTAT